MWEIWCQNTHPPPTHTHTYLTLYLFGSWFSLLSLCSQNFVILDFNSVVSPVILSLAMNILKVAIVKKWMKPHCYLSTWAILFTNHFLFFPIPFRSLISISFLTWILWLQQELLSIDHNLPSLCLIGPLSPILYCASFSSLTILPHDCHHLIWTLFFKEYICPFNNMNYKITWQNREAGYVKN